MHATPLLGMGWCFFSPLTRVALPQQEINSQKKEVKQTSSVLHCGVIWIMRKKIMTLTKSKIFGFLNKANQTQLTGF